MLGDRIVIVNEVTELRRMTQWLWTAAAGAGIAERLVHILDVCANEAVANIISYAYDDAVRHEIALDLSKTASGARLVIRDDGRAFDVSKAPAPATPASLDDARIGGLGIHLIRRMTSRCDYRRENGFNVLLLETELKPAPLNV
jgi:anti-sigma regulatory factor (Ser/Thr protein kinase)